MGADAIVAMRFDSSEIGETMTEIVAYGTAVRFARRPMQASADPEAGTAVPADSTSPSTSTFGHRFGAR
jgi:hypothetical protein